MSNLNYKAEITDLSKLELEEFLQLNNKPKFRAKQIRHFIYHHGITDFDKMTNIGKELIAFLKDNFTLSRPVISAKQVSNDGTIKWLIKFSDGNEAETVYIPEDDRGTLCISSQVGCTLTCSFCHTGTQKLVRNLHSHEIMAQLLIAKDELNDWPSSRISRSVSNIVMMGMGEPLLNYDNVIKFMNNATDGDGISISKRRLTLSTSGIVPKIIPCGEESGVNLAISLHATTDEVRNILVPINKKYPIKELLEACRNYPAANNNRRITFEYVMLKDINDSKEDAKRLVNLIKDISAKVNIIPFNPWPGSKYICSDEKTIADFAKIINNSDISAPVRRARGQDILAACGQLRSESRKVRRSLDG